jgi:hypothetical protein
MDNLEHLGYKYLVRRLPPYQDLTSATSVPPTWIGEISLVEGEYLLGVYVPVAGEPTESIAMSNRGLHIEMSGTWRFVRYDRIERTSFPDEFIHGENKLRIDRFTILLDTGEEFDVPVRKRHWKFSDTTVIMRFLLGVRRRIYNGRIHID